MVTVIARYRTAPDRGDTVATILSRHVERTRSEPGCVQFLVNRSDDDPGEFVLYEQYADEAAFQAHRDSPHFNDFIAQQVVPLLAERTWQRYHLIEPDER